MLNRYANGNSKPTIDQSRRIAEAAKHSNKAVTGITKLGRVLGPAGMALGAATAINEVANAPVGERGGTIAREAGGVAGGALGATAGTAAVDLTALALVSNPVGWTALGIMGAGLAAGAVGGYFGSEWGRSLGGWAHDKLSF
jgi:hypothetical protein